MSSRGGRFSFSDSTLRIDQLLPSVQGGLSDTVPSLKRHSELYTKPNTGDVGDPLPPPATLNQTHAMVKSRPSPCFMLGFQ